jgi:hypothetical protein
MLPSGGRTSMMGRFARVESRQRCRAVVSGVLSDLARRNGWTLAAHLGDATPDGI